MNYTQCTAELIQAAVQLENQMDVDLDNQSEKQLAVEKHLTVEKSVLGSDVIDEIRKEQHLTSSSSDDDFEVPTKPVQKRKPIVQLGHRRMTKARLAKLQQIRQEADNTQECIMQTNKLQDKWDKEYIRNVKRHQKAKAGQSVDIQKLDNPADEKFQAYQKRRFEIATKQKPAAAQQ